MSDDWRAMLDALLEHPAAWRHIAVQAEMASRRHPEGWVSHTALRRLAWACADMAYLFAGELPAEAVLAGNPAGPYAGYVFTAQEAAAAKRSHEQYRRGRRGPLTEREVAAKRQYERATATRRRARERAATAG